VNNPGVRAGFERGVPTDRVWSISMTLSKVLEPVMPRVRAGNHPGAIEILCHGAVQDSSMSVDFPLPDTP